MIHETIQRGNLSGIHFRFNPSETIEQQSPKQNALGEYALFVKTEDRSVRTACLPLWLPEQSPEVFWSAFGRRNGFQTIQSGAARHTATSTSRAAGAVLCEQDLGPNETKTFVFILSWHMPRWFNNQGIDWGVYYSKFHSSAVTAAETLAKRHTELADAARAWQQPFFDASLPEACVRRAFNSVAALAKNGVWMKDRTFVMLSENRDFPGNLISPEEFLAVAPMLMHWFPDLYESQLARLVKSQLPDGEVSSTSGNIYQTIDTGNLPGGFVGRPDSTAAFVLLAYQHYRWSGDQAWMKSMHQRVRTALLWLMSQDSDRDMAPDGPSLWPWAKPGRINLFTAGLALAALRAGDELEQVFRDLEFQSWCLTARQALLQSVNNQLWNGTKYNLFFDASSPLASGGNDPAVGMFPGEWFAQQMGWNPLIEPVRLGRAIQSSANAILASASPFFSSGKIEASQPGYRYGFAQAFHLPLLYDYGYQSAGIELLKKMTSSEDSLEIPPMADAGIWTLLSPVWYDHSRKSIRVYPLAADRQPVGPLPFSGRFYAGSVRYTHNELNGQHTGELAFRHVDVSRKDELQEVVFCLPFAYDSREMAVRVFHNGVLLPGQDFTRERSLVFGFRPSLRVRSGDTLSWIVAPKQGAKLVIDLDARDWKNLGGRCSIETIGKSVSGISCYVYNQLRDPQILQLEIIKPGSTQYAVFINGEQQSITVPTVNPAPVALPVSPIDPSEFDRVRRVVWAAGKSIIRLANEPGYQDIRSALVTIEQEANRLFEIDSRQRGVRIDLIPADYLTKSSIPKVEKPSNDLRAEFARVSQMAYDLLVRLNKDVRDPTLASELTGYFAPVEIHAVPGEIARDGYSFSLRIEYANPASEPIIGRIQLEMPDGWRAVTEDESNFDDRESPRRERTLSYTVAAASNLWEQRIACNAVLTGSWNQFAYRQTVPFSIGHDFIKRWLIIGPFSNQRGEGFDSMYPPEIDIEPDETYESLGQTVRWTEHTFMDGYVDFDSVLNPNDNTTAYAYTRIYSPREQPVLLRFGCNGDLKLFHNYKEIYARRGIHRLQPAAERLPIKLYAGWNYLLVKVSERSGPWGFYMDVTDAFGQPLREAQFDLQGSSSS